MNLYTLTVLVYYLYVISSTKGKSLKAKMFKTLVTAKPEAIIIEESRSQKTCHGNEMFNQFVYSMYLQCSD